MDSDPHAGKKTETFDQQMDSNIRSDLPVPVMQTFGLTKRFGETLAVNDLNLIVHPESVYGFLGKNGAGKTTTIRMLLGLLKPNAGKTQIFSRDLSSDKKTILKNVGLLVESPAYYAHLTGKENLEIVRRLVGCDPKRIKAVMSTVGLLKAMNMPVQKYSLGMKQRLGLAQALISEPQLLILDEPFNGLDPSGIRDIRQLIIALPQTHGTTVFLSSHLLKEVEAVADDVGIIDSGKLVFQGTLAELYGKVSATVIIETHKTEEAASFLHKHYEKVVVQGDKLVVEATADQSSVINRLLMDAGFEVSQVIPNNRFSQLEDIFFAITD